MTREDELEWIDRWLHCRGVKHTVKELCEQRALAQDCKSALLELWRQCLSPYARTVLAGPIFASGLNVAERRDVVETILAHIRENPTHSSDDGASVMLSDLALAGHTDASNVHEIGQMVLDERYDPQLRGSLIGHLMDVGNAEAILYLQRAGQDTQTGASALYALARLGAEGTLALCHKALATHRMLGKDEIKKTILKLQRQMAKKRLRSSHLVTEAIPEGMAEWSTNLDGAGIVKALRGIQQHMTKGLARQDVREIKEVVGELSIGQGARLKLPVKYDGKASTIWVETFCDDEDAYDLYVFGPPDLVEKFTVICDDPV